MNHLTDLDVNIAVDFKIVSAEFEQRNCNGCATCNCTDCCWRGWLYARTACLFAQRDAVSFLMPFNGPPAVVLLSQTQVARAQQQLGCLLLSPIHISQVWEI